MFAVLRYVPRRGRRIEVIRTDVPLGAPFYTLCVPTRRKTDWSAVRRLLRGVPLLLPEGMVIPPEIEPSVFRPKRSIRRTRPGRRGWACSIRTARCAAGRSVC